VEELLGRSRVFILTSRWEGLSIAMLEAMAAGAVPVVANVGDLADVIEDGGNGYLVAQDDIDGYADRCLRLLADEPAWGRCSAKAVSAALAHSGVDVVASQWRRHLGAVIARSRPAQGIRFRTDPPDPS
jgi:glycosyltransferase involved in cell wall biosynthesis